MVEIDDWILYNISLFFAYYVHHTLRYERGKLEGGASFDLQAHMHVLWVFKGRSSNTGPTYLEYLAAMLDAVQLRLPFAWIERLV
jgi:hypothetical protein